MVSGMVNDYSLELNKLGNHTHDNDIEKDGFDVAIHPDNEYNANVEHLSETNSPNEEEIVVDIAKVLNKNLVIDDRVELILILWL